MGRKASHEPFVKYGRKVLDELASNFELSRRDAYMLIRDNRDMVVNAWLRGADPSRIAVEIVQGEKVSIRRKRKTRYSRDAGNPQAGEVYESRWGNRWMVTGRTEKGRVLVKRAGNRYDGELQWTPSMLARLKQVRKQEATAVNEQLSLFSKMSFPSGASLLDRIRGLPQRDPNRRYYVYVIETLQRGERKFYVGQTGKRPEQRFKEHKGGHHFSYAKGAKILRTDLTRRMPILRTRQQAEKAEKIVARTLKKRGLKVIGGH